MVKCIDNKSNVFAHITVDIIFFAKKFRCLVYKVRRKYLIDKTFFVSLVKFFKSACEESKGCKVEYSLCSFFLKLLCGVLLAVGLVLPGISLSQMLYVFGIYGEVVDRVSRLDILLCS